MVSLSASTAANTACVLWPLMGAGGNASSSSSWTMSLMGCFVDFWFFLAASKCPLTVAADRGGYLRNVSTVSPGNGGRNPLVNALSMVELAGENNVA